MNWVDYGGQDVTGYDFIGTDSLKYPITADDFSVEETIEELKRRCGRLARIKLFQKEVLKDSGDR